MASVIRDPGGRKRLQFVAPSGKLKTVYLGKMELRQAQAIQVKVEAILAAGAAGIPIDGETARWVGGLPARLADKFAKAGLVAQRARSVGTTLKDLLDAFFETVDVKAGTRRTYEQTRRCLEDHFDPGTPLLAITPIEAVRWRQGLKEDGLAAATISKRVKTARQIFKQTELCASYPLADVCAWLGNSVAVASRHYLMPRDANFADAVRTSTGEKTTRNPTLYPAESSGQGMSTAAGPISQVA
jgi:hypothetical protein